MPEVTTGQIILLGISVALFAIALLISAALPWLQKQNAESDAPGRRYPVISKALTYCGLLVALAVLLWHAISRQAWVPLGDNFAALVWLGLLLAFFVLYTQRRHPVRGLDWFIMPIALLLLVAAAVFGRAKPHEYLDTAWSLVHRLCAFIGAAAFAVACAGGTMFLIVSHRLRKKAVRLASAGPSLGSLERLEHLMLVSVTIGFALLTIGAVTGLVREMTGGHGHPVHYWFRNVKVGLSAAAWLIYAIVLHSPINPSFRGRRAAVLSVVGFAMMICVLVIVQFMPVM